jgi:hypothetical protein
MKRTASYNSVARQLEKLSQHVFSNRGQSIAHEANELLQRLKEAQDGQLEAHQQPFALILTKLKTQITSLAAQKSDEELTLKAQYALIRWYAERGHYPQAMSLAREWLISVRLWSQHGFVSLIQTDRDEANRDCLAIDKEDNKELLAMIPESLHPFARLVNKIGKYRNDMMHFGHNVQPFDLGKLPKRVNAILDELPAAVLPLGLDLLEKPNPTQDAS